MIKKKNLNGVIIISAATGNLWSQGDIDFKKHLFT